MINNRSKSKAIEIAKTLSALKTERADLIIAKVKDESIAQSSCDWFCSGHSQKSSH